MIHYLRWLLPEQQLPLPTARPISPTLLAQGCWMHRQQKVHGALNVSHSGRGNSLSNKPFFLTLLPSLTANTGKNLKLTPVEHTGPMSYGFFLQHPCCAVSAPEGSARLEKVIKLFSIPNAL